MRNSKRLAGLILAGAFASPAGAYQAQSLAAHWPFSETSGTKVYDASGNQLDGDIQGGMTLGHPGAFTTTGYSARFDASQSGYAVVPDKAPLTTMLSDLTLAAWVKFETGGPSQGVYRIFGGNNSGWSGGVRPTHLRFTTRYIKDYDLAYTYPTDEWFHIVYVFDSAFDVSFYIDGSFLGKVVGAAPSGTVSGEWLIGSLYTYQEFWHGYIDDIQVYEGSLTEAEITYLFQNPGATLFGGVGAEYCFGDGSGTPCPCGNDASAGEGCSNSMNHGAVLVSFGSASVGSDDLGFTCEQMVPGKLALLFVGRAGLGGGSGLLFGDGLRCAGGGIVRLGTQVVDGAGTASWGPGLTALGGWTVGETRHFQVWYEDSAGSPCSWAFNTSHAIEISFNP